MKIPNLNLLSPKKTGLLNKLVNFIYIKKLIELIFLFLLVVAITLAWGWSALQDNFNKLSESSASTNQESSKHNQQTRQINNDIKKFDKATENFSPLFPKLQELSSLLPKEIKVDMININKVSKEFTLVGQAKTRNDLLGLEETLKKITWLEIVELPTAQLLQKENISFEIKTKLK